MKFGAPSMCALRELRVAQQRIIVRYTLLIAQ